MNAKELLDILEQFDEGELYNMEVRMAQQPEWALEYDVTDVQIITANGKQLLYVIEGEQRGYLPEQVSEEIGWN